MSLYSIPPILVAFACFALGVFALSKNLKSRVQQKYLQYSLVWGMWLFVYGIAYSQQSFALALLFLKIGYSAIIFIPISYYDFALNLLSPHRRFMPSLWISYLVGFGFTLLLWLSPYFVSDLHHYFWGFYPIAGIAHPLYLIFFSILFSRCALLKFKELKRLRQSRSSAQRQRQLQLLLMALCVGLVACVDFLPNYGLAIYPFGYVFVCLALVIQLHAIVKHQLLDIKVEITRTGLLLGVYLIILGAPFVVGWQARTWLENWIGREWWLVPLGLCTALATIGPFAYVYLRRQAEARLLKEQRRYQRTLQRAARGMTQVRDLGKLSNLITRIVSRSVHISHASLFLWDKTAEQYALRSSHGPNCLALQSRYKLDRTHPLIHWLLNRRQLLSSQEVMDERLDPAITQEMRNLGAELVIPGLIEQRLVGFLVLGQKLSGKSYSMDDLHAFTTLANEAAIAIENATSYEELLKVNQQLKAASERLLFQEKLAAAGQMAAGMAHEIKNPLASIKTFAQYLPEKYADPSFRDKFSRLVQTEIDRINEIVRELADFAKPAPLQLRPVRLAELLDDTLALLSNQCLKQGVHIHKSFSDHGITIQADLNQMKQVLLNLLLNSLEAMAKGGRLDVTTCLSDHRLVLRISDTGYGVAPEHQAHIWDPFFTTKERGMGLGLAIVKRIVDRHGGHISLSSVQGRGTTIELWFPLHFDAKGQFASKSLP